MLGATCGANIIQNGLKLSRSLHRSEESNKELEEDPTKRYAQLIYEITEPILEQWPKYQH